MGCLSRSACLGHYLGPVPEFIGSMGEKSGAPGLQLLSAIRKDLGYSERSTPAGLKLARENLQPRVKEEDSITDVKNAVFDLGVMDSLCFLFIDQRVFIGMITKLCARAQSVDGMPFRTLACMEYTRWVFCKNSFQAMIGYLNLPTCLWVIRGGETMRDSVFKHDLCKLVIAKRGSAITYDCMRSTESGEERFEKFANNSGVIGGEHNDIKFLEQAKSTGSNLGLAPAYVMVLEPRSWFCFASVSAESAGLSFPRRPSQNHLHSTMIFQRASPNRGQLELEPRPGDFGKILNKSSVETGMTEKTPNTLHGRGMRQFCKYINFRLINLNPGLRNLIAKDYAFLNHKWEGLYTLGHWPMDF
ncbi:hypothetical protein Tco_0679900 [Tanacetum coccineum]|uniref:Uncharacterized protein n=1 Tax=Tanacetum coccineum TaxID=301880 RepID=A0ABQ4XJY0_9ASTR